MKSPLLDQMIFIVGARRSGTLWLQRGLCTHSELLAIPSETHLFSHGIAPLVGLFQHGSPASIAVGSTYMDRNELMDAMRDFCDRVFVNLRGLLQPDARMLVERTPLHSWQLSLIGEIYPDARVIHIIRDGRDVAYSLLRRSWGPDKMQIAAEEWRSSVELARAGAPSLTHYRECRYEDLLSDPVSQMKDVFDWLGLEVDPMTTQAMTLEMSAPVNLIPGTTSVGVGKWRGVLTPQDLDDFDRVAGGLLAELGYADQRTEETVPAAAALADRQGKRRRHVWSREPRIGWRRRARRPQGRSAQDNQRLLDTLLTCVNMRDVASLDALFEPTSEIQIVEGHDEWRARGADAVLRLGARMEVWNEQTPALVRSDVYPVGSTVSAVLVYASPVSFYQLVMVVELNGSRIGRLACHRTQLADRVASEQKAGVEVSPAG